MHTQSLHNIHCFSFAYMHIHIHMHCFFNIQYTYANGQDMQTVCIFSFAYFWHRRPRMTYRFFLWLWYGTLLFFLKNEIFVADNSFFLLNYDLRHLLRLSMSSLVLFTYIIGSPLPPTVEGETKGSADHFFKTP